MSQKIIGLAIPYDSRLVRGLRRLEEDRAFVAVSKRIAVECNVPLERVVSTKLPGDPVALRGIPAIGRNVVGAKPETRPGWRLMHGKSA